MSESSSAGTISSIMVNTEELSRYDENKEALNGLSGAPACYRLVGRSSMDNSNSVS